MPSIFLTGFPGFLGSQLLPRVLRRLPKDVRAICLVQEKFHARARECVAGRAMVHPGLAARVVLVNADTTEERLGLPHTSTFAPDTIEIYHLAALYDLGAERSLAMKVNVDGTRHVLEFAEE